MQESHEFLFPGEGVTEETILAWAALYSPLVRFDREERHFPSDPDLFKAKARFRESLVSQKDLGWSKEDEAWVEANDESASYYDVDWVHIRDESLRRFPGDDRIQPWASRNVRPYDSNSLYATPGRRTAKGLFLQRDESLSREESGTPPEGHQIRAPLFIDAVYNPVADTYRILFWFFYELNRWWRIHTHQGDWEHISFIVSADELKKKKPGPPSHVYFAQHNTGAVVPLTSLEPFDHGHRTVFVDKNGHPTHAHVSDPGTYAFEWRTWDCDQRLIVRQPWRDFGGAWGAVGSSYTFTGPLGPLYKRQVDQVRLTRRRGKLYVKSFKQ